jgi:hypothetical protein
MTAVLHKNLWHSMPGWGIVANLLPPELIEARRAHAIRRMIAVGAACVVLLALLGFGYAKWREHSASNALSSAQDTTTRLITEQGKYNNVTQLQGTLTQIQTQVKTLMADDTRFPGVIVKVRSDLLPGMAISQLSASIDVGAAKTNASTGSGTNSGAVLSSSSAEPIGTMTMTGTAVHFSDVSQFVDRLNKVSGLANVYQASNTANAVGVQFSLQITITDAALSHRYDTVEGGAN